MMMTSAVFVIVLLLKNPVLVMRVSINFRTTQPKSGRGCLGQTPPQKTSQLPEQLQVFKGLNLRIGQVAVALERIFTGCDPRPLPQDGGFFPAIQLKVSEILLQLFERAPGPPANRPGGSRLIDRLKSAGWGAR